MVFNYGKCSESTNIQTNWPYPGLNFFTVMVVDSVDVVTTPKQCFCEVENALLQLLLSVDIVDVVFTANELMDSCPYSELLLAKDSVDSC